MKTPNHPRSPALNLAALLADWPPLMVAAVNYVEKYAAGLAAASSGDAVEARNLVHRMRNALQLVTLIEDMREHGGEELPIYTQSARELDTVIAALRFWQARNLPSYQRNNPERNGLLETMSREHGPALDDEEIDGLIERLNTEPQTAPSGLATARPANFASLLETASCLLAFDDDTSAEDLRANAEQVRAMLDNAARSGSAQASPSPAAGVVEALKATIKRLETARTDENPRFIAAHCLDFARTALAAAESAPAAPPAAIHALHSVGNSMETTVASGRSAASGLVLDWLNRLDNAAALLGEPRGN